MWIRQNENPKGLNVDDCAVRALAVATGKSWQRIYCEMAVGGYDACDMPHANKVWHKVLKQNGFARRSLPENCPECYSVRDFCEDHPRGVFVAALPDHVVAIIDGNHVDTWNSEGENVLFYFSKEEDR